MLYLSVDDGVLDGGSGGWPASCVGVYLVHTTLDSSQLAIQPATAAAGHTT